MVPGLLVLALGGCATLEYVPADVQLDVVLAHEEGFTQVRLCVAGVGQRVVGYRLYDDYVVPGIPGEQGLDVTVDFLDAEGRVLAQGTGDGLVGWSEVEGRSCTDASPCAACGATGSFAAEGEPSRLLAVRQLAP